VIPPRISIVLPTRNGMATLPAVFDAIRGQETAFTFEIVAIDSGSTDGTLEFLQRHADRTLTIPPDSFDHGLTRNAAAAEARGEYVVLLVQDAEPAGPAWLTSLVAPLVRDPQLAGTFARQQPRPDASAVTRRYLQQWVAGGETRRTVSLTRDEFDAMQPLARLERCAFDHVCAAVRRAVWLRHPYRPTPIAEDMEWAREVLLAGHRLAYVPDAVVIHSHDRGTGYEYARTYLLHHRLHELFGVTTIPTRRALMRSIAVSLAAHLRWRRGSPAPKDKGMTGVARALTLGVALPLAQYRAGAAARRGRPLERVRGV
jgi:rhamnosyltransferase